jgi:GDP-L-fucose synthase
MEFKLLQDSKIYITGHTGLVGSALLYEFQSNGYLNLITRTSSELDLRDEFAVKDFVSTEKPDLMLIAAAKVGGIVANIENPISFLFDNLSIQKNLMSAALENATEKVVFLGSSCVYPRLATQPIKEESLLTGPLELTNKPYSIAKIAGIEMLNAINSEKGTRHFTVMPCNLFGPGDNFSLSQSHVLPAMIRKFHEAKINGESRVELWGSGKPLREFLFSKDLSRGILFAIHNYSDGGIINIGSGKEISIQSLATIIAKLTGFSGDVYWNAERPDGTPRKLLDISKMTNLGWAPSGRFEDQITETYEWYVSNLGRKVEKGSKWN